ncbi:hypothetical protein D9613_009436 [Agrocybe pediades]|uniref:Uncharacterized protein n=1 Tax=Agrocybe pediades TaxID=84607 RepID=A0A8H4R306_9AGAR|nr:hypothetical protein D9613_009436 [Agrocybe pediades]
MSETVPDLASISSYPLVHLPNLKYLVVQGPPENCLALVDRIQRPSTCLVSAKAVNFDDSHVTQDLEAIGEQLFTQTFLRTLEPTYPTKLTWLFISLSYDSVTLADKHCFPTIRGTMPRFCPIICIAGSYLFFSPLSSDYVPGGGIHLIEFLFQTEIMQDVTTLRLQAPQLMYPDELRLLFWHSDTVRILELDSADTLVGLCKQGNSSYSLSFLNLEILSVLLYSRYAPAFEGEDDHPVDNGSDYVDPIVSFLRPRKIKILRAYTVFLSYWRRVFTEDARMTEALRATKLKLLPIDYEEDNNLFWDSEESMSDGEYAEGDD